MLIIMVVTQQFSFFQLFKLKYLTTQTGNFHEYFIVEVFKRGLLNYYLNQKLQIGKLYFFFIRTTGGYEM